VDIYRIGGYDTGWRLIETLINIPITQNEPESIASSNGANTCQAWQVTASWESPELAWSGLYVAVPRVGDVPMSWIPFVIRNDTRTADVVVKTSELTWFASNCYGNRSAPVGGKSLNGTSGGFVPGERAYAVTLDRPLVTRELNEESYWLNSEAPLIRFLEKQGINYKMVASVDIDANLSTVGPAKVLVSSGYDAYWTQGMRDSAEAFRDAGGHLIFMSAGTSLWRSRMTPDRRTMWCIAIGQKVITDRGLVNIEDVQTTDRVLTRNGWRNVQHRTFMGVKDCIRLTMDDGSTLVCTADHRVAVPGGWAEAGALATGSSVVALTAPSPLGASSISAKTPTTSDHGVFGRHLVPIHATGAVDVLPLADVVDGMPSELQMRRSDAHLVSTQMVNRHVAGVGEWADKYFVHDSMCLADGTVPAQVSVEAVVGSRPEPAGVSEVDLGADAVGEQIGRIHVHHITSVGHVGFLPVYDIGVDGEHEFVVNGTVVHNCYKDTFNNGMPIDQVTWTGTWKDTRWDGRKPEYLLTGTDHRMSGPQDRSALVMAAVSGSSPFWRGTSVELGINLALPEVIGFVADSALYTTAFAVQVVGTVINVSGSYIDNNGQYYSNAGNLNWGIVLQRYESGAVVAGFGTAQWQWTLDADHDGGTTPPVLAAQQATLNLFRDMGVIAATPGVGLVVPVQVLWAEYGLTEGGPVPIAPGAYEVMISDGSQWYPASGGAEDNEIDVDVAGPLVIPFPTPSSTWVIEGLGYIPNIIVIDSANSVVEPGSIDYAGTTVTLEFSAPFSGTAYCFA
jgi:hypothetical protein